MAIKISFGGASILKPGAYSKFKIDNSGGSQLANNDTLMIVGESSKGAPGDVEGIQEFSASRLDTLIEKYGSGPIVDSAFAAVRLSQRPAQGIGGAGRILVWKTNSSTQASVTLQTSAPANLYSVKDSAWGVEGNNLSVIVQDGTSPSTQKSISIALLGGTTENLGENAGTSILSVQYTGDASTASLAIAGASRAALALTTTLAGDQTDGSVNLNITLANYSIKELVDFINAQTGYTASLLSVSNSAKDSNELDPVTVADVKTSATTLRRLQYEILELLNTSGRVEATLAATPIEGLPANTSGAQLTGGAQGASINSDFSNGYSASLAEDYNMLLPAISRDAADDIADVDLGFTDASSTYTIESVVEAAKTHLNLRGSIKNRKEAQGMFGVRETTKAAAFSFISARGSELLQGTMQDIVVVDETGSVSVKQPHILAAIAAGIRLGTEVGEPLTHKFPNIIQAGHIINPTTRLESGDFNSGLDVDEAIENGVLFVEKAQGGLRFVVDNTTYGIDDNFVLNRGSVIEASFFVFKTLRETAESLFVGKKVSNGLALSIKNAVRNKLRELNAPEVNIITSSDDAPEGFREDTFVVTVSGNTARVQVEFKPVVGLDFVLFDFTLGDIQQSA